MATLLLSFGKVAAVFLIASIYAITHVMDYRLWKEKLSLTFLWGVFSVMLFLHFQDVFLNTALHLLLGSVFVHLGFFLSKDEWRNPHFKNARKESYNEREQ